MPSGSCHVGLKEDDEEGDDDDDGGDDAASPLLCGGVLGVSDAIVYAKYVFLSLFVVLLWGRPTPTALSSRSGSWHSAYNRAKP